MSHEDKTQDDKEFDSPPPDDSICETDHPPEEEGDGGNHDQNNAKKLPPPERITAICTGIIAFCTIVYSIFAGLQWLEIRQSSSDTHALATTAGIQAKATINLAEQARRSADIAEKALQANRELAQEKQRPWVGLRDFRCEDCTSDTDGTLKIGKMFGIMENTGQTPAVQMIINAVWTNRKGSDPIPDYDSIKNMMGDPYEVPEYLPEDIAAKISKTMKLTKQFTEPAPTVLPPKAVRVLPIIGRAKMGRNKMASIEDRKIFYVVGKITYYSTERDRQFVTKFCLMNDFGSNFSFCPSGNDMN